MRTRPALLFDKHVEYTPGCHLWTGWSVNGYGRFDESLPGARGRRRRWRAHRFAWTLEHGEIPAGMELDHLCGVTNCVNIEHLQMVTPEEHREVTRKRKLTV